MEFQSNCIYEKYSDGVMEYSYQEDQNSKYRNYMEDSKINFKDYILINKQKKCFT